MLKSQILEKLQQKHNNLSHEDIELLFNIFINKINNSLRHGNNIEIRGFGTLSKKINKEKYVRNPKLTWVSPGPWDVKMRFFISMSNC